MGGSDDKSNLIDLTVEEHAEAHRKLWEQNGHWQDKIAWQGLANMIDKQEIISKAQSNALKDYHSRPEIKEKYSELNKKRWSNENHRQYVSNCTKKQWEDPKFFVIHSEIMKSINDKAWSDPVKRKEWEIRNRNNNRKVISTNDGKITSWSSRTKHEKKTGYKHEWKEYDQEIRL
jgi:hypothetical protein